jgi:hypothetical protein
MKNVKKQKVCKGVNKTVKRFILDLDLCDDKDCSFCQSILTAFNNLGKTKKHGK